MENSQPKVSSNIGSLVTEFIQNYGGFIQSYRLYPVESYAFQEVLTKLRESLDPFFSWRNPISLTILRERMYLEEFLIKSHSSLVSGLISNMLDRLIRKVVIRRNVQDRELVALAELMNMPFVVLRDIGGPDIMLSVDSKVTNITVFELSMFFSETILESDSWQAAIQKTGMDVDEVSMFMQGPDRPGYLVDVDRAGRMTTRSHRLSRQEIYQLVELLLNPDILAKMILEVSTVATEDGPMIDPSEVIRILTRTENTMLFRSGYSEGKIREKLGEATELFGKNIRVAVLVEFLRKRGDGILTLNMDQFRFHDEEWALALLLILSDSEGEKILKHIKFSNRDWEKIEPHFNAMFEKFSQKIGQEKTEVVHRFQHLEYRPDRFICQEEQVENVIDSFKSAQERKSIQTAVGLLKQKLNIMIEVGYANTVLGMMRVESDDLRVREIVNNFFEQIHQMIERKHMGAIQLLSSFQELVANQDEESRERITKWLKMDGQDFISKILALISNVQLEENRSALKKLFLIFSKLGREPMSQLMDKCYFDNKHAHVADVIELVVESKESVLEILEEYLDESSFHFEHRRFLKGLSLYIQLMGQGSEPLVRKCLQSDQSPIRKAALYQLSRSTMPNVAVPFFREVLTQRAAYHLQDEKVIAIYGLGVMGDVDSSMMLKKIIENPSFLSNVAGNRLRKAALYSYAKLMGPEVSDELADLYNEATYVGLIGMISRKFRSSGENE